MIFIFKDLFSFFGEGFLSSKGTTSTFITALFSVVVWIFKPNDKIPIKIVLPIILILVIVIFSLFATVFIIYKSNKKVLPKLITVKKINEQILCLLEPSQLFSYNMMVSFYYNQGNFEQFIGIGIVHNIQVDGKIQIDFQHHILAYKEIIKKLAENNNEIIKNILIKPSIPKNIYEGGLFNEQ